MTKHRCGWCAGDELYEAYHDLEWGVPVYDDHQLFEFLILETRQLSDGRKTGEPLPRPAPPPLLQRRNERA